MFKCMCLYRSGTKGQKGHQGVFIYWSNPERQDMSFTLIVLRVLPVYWYCKVSIAMLSFNSSTNLSTLHWDFSIIRGMGGTLWPLYLNHQLLKISIYQCYRTPPINARCRSILINADWNSGIDLKCFGIRIISARMLGNFNQHLPMILSNNYSSKL